MTSYELYDVVIKANRPIDWGWIEHVKRTEGKEGIMQIARSTVECFALSGTSKNIKARATKLVCNYLYS